MKKWLHCCSCSLLPPKSSTPLATVGLDGGALHLNASTLRLQGSVVIEGPLRHPLNAAHRQTQAQSICTSLTASYYPLSQGVASFAVERHCAGDDQTTCAQICSSITEAQLQCMDALHVYANDFQHAFAEHRKSYFTQGFLISRSNTPRYSQLKTILLRIF